MATTKRRPLVQQPRSLLPQQQQPPLIHQLAFLDQQSSTTQQRCLRGIMVASLAAFVLWISWMGQPPSSSPALLSPKSPSIIQTKRFGDDSSSPTTTPVRDEPIVILQEETHTAPSPQSVATTETITHPERTSSAKCAEDRTDCGCRDPYVAQPRWSSPGTIEQRWQRHHDKTYRLPSVSSSSYQVIFVGDSIFERWGGTRGGGRPLFKADVYRNAFQLHFSGQQESKYDLESRVWATAGDTITEVLWHLQELEQQYGRAEHDENNNNDDPALKLVWVLLIGTNDLGRYGCHRETVLEGIQNVAFRLEEFGRTVLSPSARQHILVHGLLPRADDTEEFRQETAAADADWAPPSAWSLGTLWHRDIVWINRQLEQFVMKQQQDASSTKWHYMDGSSVFLFQNRLRYMPDALHPYALGYRQWADAILDHLEQLLGSGAP